MFARFRQTGRTLQISLIETGREGDRVRHRHVASLGSIALDPSPADRIAFWTKLHQRLAGLGNRMDDAARGAILAAVHARVPMPTLDDTGAVQINNAREDARFWQTVSEMHAATVEESKVLAAKLSASIAKREAIAAETAAKARAAADRLAKIEQGEDVGGIGKPPTYAELVAAVGGEAEARRCEQVAEVARLGGFDELHAETMKRYGQADRAALRTVLARRRRPTS